MTRTRIVIPWWLGILIVAGLGTLGWVLSRSSPPEAVVRTPAPTHFSTPEGTPALAEATVSTAYRLPETPYSAQNRYARSEQAAREWQPDAALVSAAASWPFVSLDDFSLPVDWTFQFYSPATGRVYTINVGQESVTPIRETLSPYELPAIDAAEWQVDSHQAINEWLNRGGGAFLKRHSIVDVSIRLARSPGGTPEWTVVGIEQGGQTVHTERIDAQTPDTG
jgi:hypothetical protein